MKRTLIQKALIQSIRIAKKEHNGDSNGVAISKHRLYLICVKLAAVAGAMNADEWFEMMV